MAHKSALQILDAAIADADERIANLRLLIRDRKESGLSTDTAQRTLRMLIDNQAERHKTRAALLSQERAKISK